MDPDRQEFEQTQKSEESESGESTDNKLDSLIGTETEESDSKSETQESTESTSTKEDKKQRDFEKAYFKEREETRRLKAEIEANKQNQTTPTQTKQYTPEEQEALGTLKGVVRDVLNEDRDTRSAIEEVRSRPYFDVLSSHILEEAKKLPTTLSESERLSLAYNAAAANNLDVIVKTAREVGQKEGFENRSFKRNQGSIRETPRSGQSSDDQVRQRYNEGSLSDEEFAELRKDGTLRQWEKEDYGI